MSERETLDDLMRNLYRVMGVDERLARPVTLPTMCVVTECADCPLFAGCAWPALGVRLPSSCPLRAAPVFVRLRLP